MVCARVVSCWSGCALGGWRRWRSHPRPRNQERRRRPRSASPQRDPHRRHRRRRQPVRARTVPGRGRRREGRRGVPQQQGRRRRTRRAQGRGRLLRLEAQRQRAAQRHHPGLPERLRPGRHLGAVPHPGHDIVNCKDQAGAATGIPDMSAVTTGVPESCSPMSFPAYGTALDCPTVEPEPADRTTGKPVRQPSTYLKQHKNGSARGSTLFGERHHKRPAQHGGEVLDQHRRSRPGSKSTIRRSASPGPCPADAYTPPSSTDEERRLQLPLTLSAGDSDPAAQRGAAAGPDTTRLDVSASPATTSR